jgi:hypothetical protein
VGPEEQARTLCVIVKTKDDSAQYFCSSEVYIFAYSCFGILRKSLILMFIYCSHKYVAAKQTSVEIPHCIVVNCVPCILLYIHSIENASNKYYGS